jgi:hypothetical protein
MVNDRLLVLDTNVPGERCQNGTEGSRVCLSSPGATLGHVNRDIDATAIIAEWMMTL